MKPRLYIRHRTDNYIILLGRGALYRAYYIIEHSFQPSVGLCVYGVSVKYSTSDFQFTGNTGRLQRRSLSINDGDTDDNDSE